MSNNSALHNRMEHRLVRNYWKFSLSLNDRVQKKTNIVIFGRNIFSIWFKLDEKRFIGTPMESVLLVRIATATPYNLLPVISGRISEWGQLCLSSYLPFFKKRKFTVYRNLSAWNSDWISKSRKQSLSLLSLLSRIVPTYSKGRFPCKINLLTSHEWSNAKSYCHVIQPYIFTTFRLDFRYQEREMKCFSCEYVSFSFCNGLTH